MEAVKQNGLAVEYASDQLKEDSEVVQMAFNNNHQAIQYVQNKELVKSLLSQDGLALQYLSDHFKADREVVQAAFNQNPAALEHAAPKLQTRYFEMLFTARSFLEYIWPNNSYQNKRPLETNNEEDRETDGDHTHQPQQKKGRYIQTKSSSQEKEGFCR